MKLLKVGVTGGIGSGKSTVCRVFEALGVPVYYADSRARELSEQHPDIVTGYKSLLGKGAYTEEGKLNRPFVASQIFSDKGLLEKVNQLVHPVVQKDFLHWAQHFETQMVIEEAAILLESGGHHHLDFIILVTAPEQVRIQRVVSRDGGTPQMVKDRMDGQWTDMQRMPLADFIIHNNDHDLVIPQVLKIYKAIIGLE